MTQLPKSIAARLREQALEESNPEAASLSDQLGAAAWCLKQVKANEVIPPDSNLAKALDNIRQLIEETKLYIETTGARRPPAPRRKRESGLHIGNA